MREWSLGFTKEQAKNKSDVPNQYILWCDSILLRAAQMQSEWLLLAGFTLNIHWSKVFIEKCTVAGYNVEKAENTLDTWTKTAQAHCLPLPSSEEFRLVAR